MTSRPTGMDDASEAARALRILERMPGFAWSADPSGQFTYVSPNTFAYLGNTRGDLNLKQQDDELGWRGVVHPDDYQRVAAKWRHCLQTGEPYDAQHRLRHFDGSYRWFRNSGSASRDAQGNITAWYGTTIDIDDQKQAEAALSGRERELSQLVDLVPSHLWRLTPDGEPVFFNKRMRDYLGFGVEHTLRPDLSRLEAFVRTAVHPDDAADMLAALSRSLATGDPFALRYRLRRADGAYHWMSSRAEPLRDHDGSIVQWYGLCHDIDDQVRAEGALRDRERELQQLIDTVPVQIWCVTPDGEPAYINKTMTDYTGLGLAFFNAQGGLREAIQTLVHPDDRTMLAAGLRHSFTTGEPFALNYRNRRADGVFRWTEGHAAPFRDEDGRIRQWYGVNVDIDEKVRLISDLEEREARIRRLVESNIIGIVFWDIDGTLIDANDAFLDMVQYDRDDVKAGLRWLDMTPPDWQEIHATVEAEELARTGRMQVREKEYFRKDGSRVPVLIGGAFFEGQTSRGVAYILDLTERKRAEAAQARAEDALREASDRLTRASQAAGLSELSASIAHEVNQPLAAIVANSHACHRWLSADPPNLERAKVTAERIVRDANAAAEVVSRIRALFKQSSDARGPMPLADVVAEARDLLAEEAARSGTRVDLEIDGDLPEIVMDRIQIQQVLVNLMRNAIEAMEATPDHRVLRLVVRRSGDTVQVEVRDRGPGLERPERIFEPFFTTKPNGMGMGLAICKSILESHGGRLWVEGNEPQGASFIFAFPTANVEAV